MKKYMIYTAITVVAIVVIFLTQRNAQQEVMEKTPTVSIKPSEKTTGMMDSQSEEDTQMIPSGESMMNENDSSKMKDDDKTEQISYTGTQLAGKSVPFLMFTQEDFNAAKKAHKIIVLDFYANWCPTCRAEAPELYKGFDALTSTMVVGFRVNFNDSETDAFEKALAKEFSIPYQHTKVIIKNNKILHKDGNIWDSATLIKQVEAVL